MDYQLAPAGRTNKHEGIKQEGASLRPPTTDDMKNEVHKHSTTNLCNVIAPEIAAGYRDNESDKFFEYSFPVHSDSFRLNIMDNFLM